MDCTRPLRSAHSMNGFYYVNSNGNWNNNNANNTNGVVLGFSPNRQSSQIGEIRFEGREGAHDPPMWVNIHSDASGRTLLAWYGLQVIPYFMPGDTMCLVQPAQEAYEAPDDMFGGERNHKRRTARNAIPPQKVRKRAEKRGALC